LNVYLKPAIVIAMFNKSCLCCCK